MARQKFSVKIVNYGLYDHWNRESKELPRFLKFTTEIPTRLDIEFGYILDINYEKNVIRVEPMVTMGDITHYLRLML